ncbi:MAG: AAA family ATPase [Candidatus Kapaibacterium sp.]
MEPFIKKLRIVNYKSIADLTIENIGPFAVFAGANGSGKSTIFEALEFVNHVVRFGCRQALYLHGGWANVHNFRLDDELSKVFEFEIVVHSYNSSFATKNPANIEVSERKFLLRIEDFHEANPKRIEIYNNGDNSVPSENEISTVSDTIHSLSSSNQIEELGNSILRYLPELESLLGNLLYYSFNPNAARESTLAQFDNSLLDKQGRNLAAVLSRLESDSSISDSIIELMQLFVPSLESVKTETNSLDGRSGLQFIEEGLSRPFPPHLISDGTLHALNILVALFQRKNNIPLMGTNWTLIEEPERGLHPYAVQELTSIIREAATSLKANSVGVEKFQPFWLTTHSASLVRACRPGELWFVEKTNGFTTVRKADPHPQSRLPLDEAWLSNALDGGLPW